MGAHGRAIRMITDVPFVELSRNSTFPEGVCMKNEFGNGAVARNMPFFIWSCLDVSRGWNASGVMHFRLWTRNVLSKPIGWFSWPGDGLVLRGMSWSRAVGCRTGGRKTLVARGSAPTGMRWNEKAACTSRLVTACEWKGCEKIKSYGRRVLRSVALSCVRVVMMRQIVNPTSPLGVRWFRERDHFNIPSSLRGRGLPYPCPFTIPVVLKQSGLGLKDRNARDGRRGARALCSPQPLACILAVSSACAFGRNLCPAHAPFE